MLPREQREHADWGDDAFEPTPVPRQVRVTGRVFLDRDGDGSCSGDDEPLPNIAVCDEEHIVETDADGCFGFSMSVEEHRLVWMQQPSGFRATTPWYGLIRADDTDTTANFEFGLQPTRETADGRDFRFVVIADSQFDTEAAADLLEADMNQIGVSPDSHEFMVNCGDMVLTGWLREWNLYARATRVVTCPFYHVAGGHEMNYGKHLPRGKPSDGHFKLYTGPTYYAFDCGGVHFIVTDTHRRGSSEATLARQEQWLQRDRDRLAPNTPIVIFSHYPLDLDPWLEKCRVMGVFFGHWHRNALHHYRNVPFLQPTSMRGGDWGMFSRVMRICEVRDGELHTELRVLGQHRRVELIQGADAVSVLAYDTVRHVNRVTLRSDDGATAELERVGDWTWQGPWSAGRHESTSVVVEVEDSSGDTWQTTADTAVVAPPPRIHVDADWPWFGRDLGNGRWTNLSLRPPLIPAWRIPTGSRMQLSNSPILHEGKLFVATQNFDIDGPGPQLLCIDPANGRIMWRRELEGNAGFSPAATDGKVFVTTSQGVTAAFRATDGESVWRRCFWGDDGNWEFRVCAGPIVPHHDGRLIVAAEGGPFAVYAVDTGRTLLWQDELPTSRQNLWHSAPYPVGDILYWNCYYGNTAQDLSTGDVLWTTDTQEFRTRAVSMGMVRDGVFFQNSRYSTMALDCGTGDVLWHQPMENGSFGPPAVVVGPETLISGGAERICLSRTDGSVAWKFATELPATQEGSNRGHTMGGHSTPCIAGDVAYFGGENGYLYAVDAGTGECLWRYYLGLPIMGSPIISGNALFVSDFDGNLHGFVAADDSSS
ncbi:MAG: PQQ-binding-like beta-propeller repeat protein [Lentisphaeria bacterium]|jgi:outer membrane protein assembly factor BamB|nr:PQQ-binding-like beta-propeller repeat protein [Lentisphaeria bacterium]MDP7741389.1 PQQ-binding-like beta-propeller repeat protein [Lentisphaeria bacterium]